MSDRIVPEAVRGLQNTAADPEASAWVSANAGSGKTHVLAQRVIRLLLTGVDPAKILCITFTKAAAANMAMRVFNTLRAWTTLEDSGLDASIVASGAKPDPDARARARRLFALALETPGGLKVQTIHAFCTALLHQFPFEAGVAARFSVLDEAAERQLLDQTSLKVLLEGASEPGSALGRALEMAIAAAADQTFREVVNEAIGQRDALEAWINAAGSVPAAIDALAHALGINPADTMESVQAEFFAGTHIPLAAWPDLALKLAAGQKSDQGQAERFNRVQHESGAERLDTYLTIFCTATLDPRKNLVTAEINKNHPELVAQLKAEQERVCRLLNKQRAVSCRDRTSALVTVADAVIKRYRAEKDRRGLLDYDDLIEKALTLLDNVDAAWVHYKLDLGIDHVLIDEAQDTSPQQWEIVRRLVAEFIAGEGARTSKRTLFAVGDHKQSIFSFQGAAPRKFSEMQNYFESAFKKASLGWHSIELHASFRSGPVILQAVDAVFKRPQAYQGLTADPVETVHEPLPNAPADAVEIWDLIGPQQKLEVEPWDAPFDLSSEQSPQVRLARKIARHVALWGKRGARAGDVLILVRQRGPLFGAIIRALKDEMIEVAGADRLMLTDHIAVMDLIALADALLLPDDDLALATVLKSPLFGLDENELFTLAAERGRLSLRQSLLGKAGENEKFARAVTQIERLTEAARNQTPFAFYAGLLGAGGGRKRILARLGAEANDALDEFLNLALTYESRATPSLQGFVAWLRAAQAEVKRDMEMARDEVRVMTVHGAKGLEAPIVILADTTTRPAGYHPPRLLKLPAGGVPGSPDHLVWATARKNDTPLLADARARAQRAAEDEYRRLLYVGMTRAARRLVVCGAEGIQKRPDGCWYDLVRDALAPDSVEFDTEDGDGKVLRYRSVMPAVEDRQAAAEEPRRRLPDWLTREVLPEVPALISVAPSGWRDTDDTGRAIATNVADRVKALMRGRMLHRLMQSLPDLAAERREEAARRHLARSKDFSDSERAEMLAQVLKVIGDPRFAPLFAPGSRAEVPIVGRIAGGNAGLLHVSGQVDRLAVTDKEVLIADYKTDRPAPRRLEDVPPEYRRQLAHYRAVLGLIYPGRVIRAALVWTDLAELMEIPAALLDAELAQQAAA